jgi:hypothetical protein
MSDQPVAETSTYVGQHNIQTSMPSAGFEIAIPGTKRPQTDNSWQLQIKLSEVGMWFNHL